MATINKPIQGILNIENIQGNYRSINGTSWLEVASPGTKTIESVGFGNGVFIAVGSVGSGSYTEVLTAGFIIDTDVYRLNN